jgi:hypothetical protein
MRRIERPSLFLLVPLKDARRLTGMNAEELGAAAHVQLLTRVFADGRTEEAFRVPRTLLLESGEPEQATA